MQEELQVNERYLGALSHEDLYNAVKSTFYQQQTTAEMEDMLKAIMDGLEDAAKNKQKLGFSGEEGDAADNLAFIVKKLKKALD